MLYRVIDETEAPALVAAFMERYEVVAPVKRGDKYVFSAVDSFDEIALDYPTTIASPKKYLLPAKETLFEFDAENNEVTDYTDEVRPRVLFGVHACDINGLQNLSSVFNDPRYPDPYYAAHAAATLIVGVACMPSANCFCNLMDAEEARAAYDLFLTNIGGRYLVSIGSVVAANILEAACDVREATDEDRIAFRAATRARQEAFNRDIPDIQEIPMLMDAFHEDEFWEELGGRCLSCNACANVCPTCYCFDIRDTLDPGRGHGAPRARVGRLHLAAVRHGGRRPQLPAHAGLPRAAPHVPQAQRLSGQARPQPLRGLRPLRFRLQSRHQPHRGAEVLRPKGGLRAMANDNIVAVHPFRDAGREATGAELMHANPYRPWPARITSITELTPTEKLFEFRFVDERIREAFRQEPGQFVELSIFGVGEAPISISSSPTKQGFIELCVRRTGRFTERLHQMQCGEIVGIRGPFGRGFPIDEMRGHDVLLVAGGLGIAPLRSLINNIHDERSEFGKVTIIYGSKNPSEVMFRNQFEMWKHRKDFELHLTVDHPDDTWDGEVGLVTKPFEHLEIDPTNTFGALCGPPIMYRFVVQEMRKKDIPYDRIYMSFERHMKCGVGKCGHCQVGHQYCCIDGPVFNYWEAKNIQGSM